MRNIYLIMLIFIGFSNMLIGQSISKKDSLEISNKIEDWNTGWKIKDYIIATKWYSKDAEFTNAFGHNRIGKTEIETLLKEVFQLSFVMSGDSKVNNQKYKRISDNVILVVTTIERIGQKSPDNMSIGTRRTTHHRLFKKEKDWIIVSHLISDARDTTIGKH